MPDFKFPVLLNSTEHPVNWVLRDAVYTARELTGAQRGTVEQDHLVIYQLAVPGAYYLAIVGVEPTVPRAGPEVSAEEFRNYFRQDYLPALDPAAEPRRVPKYPSAYLNGLPTQASKWQGITPLPTQVNAAGVVWVYLWQYPPRRMAREQAAGPAKLWLVTDVHIRNTQSSLSAPGL